MHGRWMDDAHIDFYRCPSVDWGYGTERRRFRGGVLIGIAVGLCATLSLGAIVYRHHQQKRDEIAASHQPKETSGQQDIEMDLLGQTGAGAAMRL
jgi:hypothetical protein